MDDKPLKIKGKYIVIGIILVGLIAGISIFLNLQNKTEDDKGYNFSVSKDEKILKTYSLDDIKKMEPVKAKAKINSTNKKSYEGTFTGVPIESLLNDTDESLLEDSENFIFIAGDGYSSAISKRDIEKKENVILAYAMDGKDLEHFSDGGQGPMRIVILSDQFGNRSTMWAVQVECK